MARRTLAPALRRLITGGRAVESKGLSARVRTFYRQYVVPGQPYSQHWNTDRAVREGFEVNPWIYRAVHVIASAAVSREIHLRMADPELGEPVPRASDPTRLTYLFNVQANPWERAKVFRYRLIAQALLSSKGVFVEVVRTRSGGIGLLNLIDPDMVDPMPIIKRLPNGQEASDPIGAFRVRVNDDRSGPYNDLPRFSPSATFSEQPQSILWVRLPHPTVMFTGMSPMQAAGLSADLDRAARLYNKRFMDQDGRPGGILAVKGRVEDNTLERLEARFNGGPASAGRTTAIQADAMNWVDTSNHPRDTQWGDTMDRMRKEVSIAFGVPESILGDASGRTFDNADAERENFYIDTMKTLTDMLDDQLDVLTGAYDDDLFFRHDWSGEWVLNRHHREEVAKAAEDFGAGRITLNEYRAVAHLDELDLPAARVLFIPGGSVVAGLDPEDVTAVAQLPTVGAGAPADPAAEARQGAAEGSALGARRAENSTNARALRLVEGRDNTALEGKQGGARA